MKYRPLFGVLFFLSLGCLADSSITSKAIVFEDNKIAAEPIIQGTLSNGLQYSLLPLKDQSKRISLYLAVNAGSIDEEDHQSGVAHMVEHLVFHETEQYPQGMSNYLHQHGWVRALHYNALTNFERTLYMMSPPNGSKDLPLALDALSQMVGHAKITDNALTNERKIILEEWRTTLGVAERMNRQRTQSIRYGSRYPLRPVIGTEASILGTNTTALQQFYQRWYKPNNMRLVIVGDISADNALLQIEKYFGKLSFGALPQRDYYEPKLTDEIKIFHLQDIQSGSSQVTLTFRFDEQASRKEGFDGVRQRLIDKFTLQYITQKLSNQKSILPDDVSSLVVKKSFIGQTTAALGFFAQVKPDGGHHAGLSQLIIEIERLKQHPPTDADLQPSRVKHAELIARSQKGSELRDFTGWTQKANDRLVQGKPWTDLDKLAEMNQQAMDTITVDDIYQRILLWTGSTDIVVQYMAPGLQHIDIPKPQTIADLFEQNKQVSLPPFESVKQIESPILLPALSSGHVIRKEITHHGLIEYWYLSNNDVFVWMRKPAENNKAYFTISNKSGFLAPELDYWPSQLASQLVINSGPAGWTPEQLKYWSKEHAISLNVTHKAEYLQFDGQAKTSQLSDLFQLYYAYSISPQIDNDLLKENIHRLARLYATAKETQQESKQEQIIQLRFGENKHVAPTEAELINISDKQLRQQWQIMNRSPVTYYLMADLPTEQLQPLVEQYLSSIERGSIITAQPSLAKEGAAIKQAKINQEPRTDTNVYSFTVSNWSPKKAIMISYLSNIAAKRLKTELRDKELGIYRMNFTSTLNPEHNRIETEIFFGSSPERANELWLKAKLTLEQLPNNISETELQQQKALFSTQEKSRLADPVTLFNRLRLSDRYYHDARYLSEMDQLGQDISLLELQELAGTLLNHKNTVIFISQPIHAKVQ